jgi:lysozyme family protein
MKNIETELDAIISIEGGYVNDPKDSGGETNFGITKFVAESFGYTGKMIDLTKEQAKEIYRKRYWIQPKFDKVFAISPAIAFELFDTGINMGVNTAGRFLQRSLNVLNSNSTLYPDMSLDGVLGDMTLTALTKFLAARKSDGETVLLRMLNALQSVKYIELAESRPKDEAFQFGWQKNRVGM